MYVILKYYSISILKNKVKKIYIHFNSVILFAKRNINLGLVIERVILI